MIIDNSATYALIRNEISDNEAMRDTIRMLKGKRVALYPGWGNVGDALINLGMFDLLQAFDWTPDVIHGDIGHDDIFAGYDHAVLAGGGGWLEGVWDHYVAGISAFLDRGGQLTILPTTFMGFGWFFKKYAGQVRLFCREKHSYDQLAASGVPETSLHLCHDLAFFVSPAHLVPYSEQTGQGILQIFRADEESAGRKLPYNSVDLPLVFNTIHWTSQERCLRPIRAIAHVFSEFAEVHTDRLHMSVLGSLLNKKVRVFSNSYFKNQGIFEYTSGRFAGVDFVPMLATPDKHETKRSSPLRHVSKFFAKRP